MKTAKNLENIMPQRPQTLLTRRLRRGIPDGTCVFNKEVPNDKVNEKDEKQVGRKK